MEQYVAFATSNANFSGDFDGIDSKQDVEIRFLPSIALDSGFIIGTGVKIKF